jgi:hypothetical protein
MNPRPRVRKAIKWVGAASTVLLAVAWIGSGKYGVGWASSSGAEFVVRWGECCVNTGSSSLFGLSPGLSAGSSRFMLFNEFVYERRGSGGVVVVFPLWPPALLALLPTAIAWRFDVVARRRERIGRCPKCNYDRAGIAADAKCPECGASPANV